MNSPSLTFHRPYPHLPRLERKKRPMTIAVGFVYDDGLVFCVDTKISTNIKTNESKLSWCVYGEGRNCATAFAISAMDLKFAKSAVDFCEDAVARIDFKDAGVGIESVKKAIQSALTKFYKEHVFPHPDRGVPGVVDFEFLIGIWLNNETRLYESRETILSPISVYECRGQGAYLAKYLIRQYLEANPGPMTLQGAALIANYAVSSVMDYDESCGGEREGDPEILIVRNSGDCDNAYSNAAYPSVTFAKELQGEFWKLLHDLSHIKGDNDLESPQHLEAYFERIRKLNASHSWVSESMRGMKKNIWFPES